MIGLYGTPSGRSMKQAGIEAIKSGLGALRFKTYLATISDNVIDPETGGIKESLLRRAEIFECKIIPGWKLREMAELYFRKSPKFAERVVEEFEICKVARK